MPETAFYVSGYTNNSTAFSTIIEQEHCGTTNIGLGVLLDVLSKSSIKLKEHLLVAMELIWSGGIVAPFLINFLDVKKRWNGLNRFRRNSVKLAVIAVKKVIKR